METRGHTITGAQATLDDADVTSALINRVTPGTLIPGGEILRCPDLCGAFIGAGIHVLKVSLDLIDGSTVNDTVIWMSGKMLKRVFQRTNKRTVPISITYP
jgi:hypothetical protein